MANRVITPPSVEPVSLSEARKHLRLVATGSPPSHEQDANIQIYIAAAREWIEQHVGLSIGTQTREEVLDAFPEFEIELPFGPVQTVESVKYLDPDEAEITLGITKYFVDTVNRPQVVMPAVGEVWPSTVDGANAVKIRYVTGYANDVSPNTYPTPKAIKLATLLLVGHYFENREATSQGMEIKEIPLAVQNLLWPLRNLRF